MVQEGSQDLIHRGQNVRVGDGGESKMVQEMQEILADKEEEAMFYESC